MNAHLSSAHRGSRPILLIDGREPATAETIRQAVGPDDIAVANCTSVNIWMIGKPKLSGCSPETLRTRIVGETDTEIECELLNEFERLARPIAQRYVLTLRIPDKQALDNIDRDFREILARDALTMLDISRFLSQTGAQGAAWEYADALASYVRGVLVKDGTGGATLPPSEAVGLFSRARETLKEFCRPLPDVICGLVCLAANDFSAFRDTPGFPRLNRCCTMLREVAKGLTPALGNKDSGVKSSVARTVALCPIDRTLDMILTLADPERMRPALLKEYRQAAMKSGLTPEDRAKIHALHVLAALHSNAHAEAREPLRQLRNNYPFGIWATQELDRLND